MTGGIGLIYVGCVLLINGIGMFQNFDSKALAVMNFFTGGIYVVINIINLTYAVFAGQDINAFYGVGTSMLFGFTYCRFFKSVQAGWKAAGLVLFFCGNQYNSLLVFVVSERRLPVRNYMADLGRPLAVVLGGRRIAKD